MAGNVRLALDLHPPKPMLVIFSDHMFYCTMPKIYVSVFFFWFAICKVASRIYVGGFPYAGSIFGQAPGVDERDIQFMDGLCHG